MTSEREFIIASLLNHSPDTALKLQTLRDIFQIKEKGNHYKRSHEQLKSVPYNSLEL